MGHRPLVCTALAVLLLATAASGAGLEARVDRTQVAPGESFVLTLRLRDGDAAPDLSPLERDFELLHVVRSQRISVVNGRRDDSKDWQVTLAPKRAGSLEIPAIAAGAAVSAPLRIEVADSRLSPSTPLPEPGAATSFLSLDARVDDPEPYVQSRVKLTVTVQSDGSLVDARLSEPVVPGAVVEQVGEDRAGARRVGGRDVRMIEREYAIFPQRSGPLQIPRLVLDGRVRDSQAARHDPFGSAFDGAFFGDSILRDWFGPATRPVRVRSQPLTLDVRPRPAEAEGRWWLPARSLELVEEWETDPPRFRVGEPVNRVIAIRATGLSGGQLPELALPQPDGAKQYSEPAQDQTFARGDEVVAVKLQRTALIPTRAGSLTLPAIELSWWDTRADEARVATLPSRVVEVLPGPDGLAAAAAPGPPVSDSSDASASGSKGPDLASPGVDASTPFEQLAIGSGAGLGALLLGTAAIVAIRRRRTAVPPATGGAGRRGPSLRAAERALRRACRADDAAAAGAALRELARARWPDAPPQSAAAWSRLLGSVALREEIERLHRARFAPGASRFEGSCLWRAYRKAARRGRRRRRKSRPALPSLYPTL